MYESWNSYIDYQSTFLKIIMHKNHKINPDVGRGGQKGKNENAFNSFHSEKFISLVA